MTFSRLHISVILGFAVLVWSLVLLVQRTAVGWEHIRPFSIVVGFLVVLGTALENFAWRHPWLHGWFVKRPDLRGTWRVEMQSDWINPEVEEKASPNICYVGVSQTLSTLQMHLMTNESESWFIADRIRPSPSGKGYQVVGVYTNKPHIHLRGDRSEMHQGALVLNTHGPDARPEALTGEYWTDRKTSGSIHFVSRISELITRFDDGERLFSSSQTSH